MEKSLALVVPDRPGVLREVMHVFSENDVSVLRMSYNRVVDVHTLFVDVWGTSAALKAAEKDLRAWRFFPGQRTVGEVFLLELRNDENMSPLEPVIMLINRYEFNITYVSARIDGDGSDIIQIGVYVEDPDRLDALLSDIDAVCDVRVVPRGEHSQLVDNNHFISSFAHGLAKRLRLDAADEEEILINSNRIMQNLDREESDPYRPFSYIYQAGEAIASYHGDAFAAACRITRYHTAAGLSFVCIEPPAGSTTWVLECADRLLCIDGGYCCFAGELEHVLCGFYPTWADRNKELVITHGDIDHVGICHLFGRVYASGRVIDNFTFETMGIAGWREQNPLSFPYTRIGNVLSRYRTPATGDMVCLGEPSPMGEQRELFRRIDTLEVNPLCFEVYEGKGGHVRGEIVLIERTHRICVSGDIFVNVHGETKPQSRFNALAPYLMTSVDSVPDLAREERVAMFDLLDEGDWQILGGHGNVFDWHR